MPFGLCNAPTTFQMNDEYNFERWTGSDLYLVFLDDILIFSRTIKEHE